MRHELLPQSKTVEELAAWLTENALEKKTHVKEEDLTIEGRHEHEAKIANATAAIYELQALEKRFKTTIKKGTDGLLGELQPETFTVPPTKGIDILESNRQFSNQILKDGVLKTNVELFGIPDDNREMIVFFDIEGNLMDEQPMGSEQRQAAGKLFSETDAMAPMKAMVQDFQKKGIEVSVIHDGKETVLTGKKGKKKTAAPENAEFLEKQLFPDGDEANPLEG